MPITSAAKTNCGYFLMTRIESSFNKSKYSRYSKDIDPRKRKISSSVIPLVLLDFLPGFFLRTGKECIRIFFRVRGKGSA